MWLHPQGHGIPLIQKDTTRPWYIACVEVSSRSHQTSWSYALERVTNRQTDRTKIVVTAGAHEPMLFIVIYLINVGNSSTMNEAQENVLQHIKPAQSLHTTSEDKSKTQTPKPEPKPPNSQNLFWTPIVLSSYSLTCLACDSGCTGDDVLVMVVLILVVAVVVMLVMVVVVVVVVVLAEVIVVLLVVLVALPVIIVVLLVVVALLWCCCTWWWWLLTC